MRKLLPVVFSGLAAISFSQLAFSQGATVNGTVGGTGVGAGVSLDKGGSTTVSPEVQNSQSGSASTGADRPKSGDAMSEPKEGSAADRKEDRMERKAKRAEQRGERKADRAEERMERKGERDERRGERDRDDKASSGASSTPQEKPKY